MEKTVKKVVFIDMDGPMANFDAAVPLGTPKGREPACMLVPGFFRSLTVTPGAREGVAALLANPDLAVYVGSKHSTKNTWSASEKLQWILISFPALLRRVVLTCDKGLLLGAVLIDDDAGRWKKKFSGEFIEFDNTRPEESWKAVVAQLCPTKG